MSAPLPIAFVITELNVGGAERCLTRLAVGIDRRRFDPAVYALGRRPVGQQADLVERLEAAGISVELIGATHWRQFAWAMSQLTKRLRARPPALVQSFLIHANITAALAARQAEVPIHVAGIRVAEPSGLRLIAERLALRNAARIVCVSEQVAEHCRTRAGLPKGKLVVIPNGVDVEAFASAVPAPCKTLSIGPSDRLLLFVGRLETQKGIDWLIELSPRIFERLPRHRLLIVGDGPLRGSCERRVRELGVSDRVRFLGWRPDVPSLLKACEVLVLPSRWEGMPNVLLEAMAASRPVLSTRVEGVEEILGTDWLPQSAPFGNDAEFLERLAELVGGSKDPLELGRRNRERAAERFSWKAVISAYEDLYDSLLGSPVGQEKNF